MSHRAYLEALLEPLGVYSPAGTIGGGELTAVSAGLDTCAGALEAVEREMLLTTAVGQGLERVESLLVRRPVTSDLARRRAALAALLRIGGDSFTLAAINDNLRGCGLNAVASETTGPGRVVVRFPEVPGIPAGFEDMQVIIEEILPCHLEITYDFWFVTWGMLEARFPNWGQLELLGLNWSELETLVQ